MTSKLSSTLSKIREVEQLAGVLSEAKAAGKTVVHCHGVFDLLHVGHIRHFEQAHKLGDILVVTTTPDRFVNKGPSRPVFGEELRAEVIAALDCVDYVAINRWPMAVETIQLLRPDFYVKGSDYRDANGDITGGIELEETAVNSVGGRLVFTDDIVFSASNLINHYLPVFPPEVRNYLDSFAGRYSSNDVLGYLDRARGLKVLVVGETIIDEYVYCETLGKSGKEPVLASRQLECEKFAGGIIPPANNVSAFCDEVGLVTFLGQGDSQEEFVREKLNQQINQMFLYMDGGAPTIVKRRFVEAYPFQKLFELYVMEDGDNRPAESNELCDKLEKLLPNYDLVVVLDYGHGMLGPEAVDLLCSRAPFLAINTQVNAGNRGFNTVSKYHRADFICVSENELRLETRSRRQELQQIVSQVSQKLDCERVLITRGAGGSLSYGKREGFFDVPAFATEVVDRVGAGDAVFSVASLAAALDAPMELVGFIGNVVGAEAVATMGHRSSIERVPLYRHIETLLK